MWFAGIIQGLMLNETDASGTHWRTSSSTVDEIAGLMLIRAIGGTLYLIGFVLLVINIWKTARTGEPVNETRVVYDDPDREKDSMTWNPPSAMTPVAYTFWGLFFGFSGFSCLPARTTWRWIVTAGFVAVAVLPVQARHRNWSRWYEDLRRTTSPSPCSSSWPWPSAASSRSSPPSR